MKWAFPLPGALLLAALARAQTPGTAFPERLQQLSGAVEQRRLAQHIPGMGLAVVKDDQVVLCRGFGLRDREQQLPASGDTLFAIGSTTKAFTSMLLATLVDEGKVQWDDPVQKHVPFFAVADPGISTEITLRDLLCHRTGVPRESILWYPGIADAEAILHQTHEAQLSQPFRKAFQYNNVMYLAAGYAAQCAGEMSWSELLQHRILDPLAMSSTNASIAATLASPEHAVGYAWHGDTAVLEALPMRPLTSIAPAGAINSSARDMSQWVRFLLRRGLWEERQLVRSERFDEMWTAQDVPGASYGLGWFVQSWHGKTYVEHGGNIDGFAATVGLLPEEHLGYVLLTNLNTPPIQQEMPALVWNTLLGEGPGRPEDTEVGRPGAPMSSVEVEPYVGRYRVPGMEEPAEVLLDDGRLVLKVPMTPDLALSWPDPQGRWALPGGGPAYAQFESTEKGFVSAITLHQGPSMPNPTLRRIESEDPLPLTSEELLERVRAALGTEAVPDLPPFALEGTICHQNQGLTGKLVTFVDGPDRLAQIVDYGPFGSTRRFYASGKGFDQPLGAPAISRSDAAAEKIRAGSPLALIGDWFEFFDDVEVVRADTIRGHSVFLVRLTPRDGLPAVTRVIDAESDTVFQDRGAAVFTGMDTEGLTLEYGDYREVSGVQMPFRITVEVPAHGTTVVQYDACVLDPEVPEEWFRGTGNP